MARNKQKLINYHSSTASAVPEVADLELGEIAIQHADESGATIFTKVGEGKLAKFITEVAVDAKIATITGGDLNTAKEDIKKLSTGIDEIKDSLGSGFSATDTVAEAIASAKSAADAAQKTADAKISNVSEGTDSPYLTIETSGTEVIVTFTKGTGDDELATVKAAAASADTLSKKISVIEQTIGDSGTTGIAKEVEDLKTKAEGYDTTLATITGDSGTTGSIKKAEADAKAHADAKVKEVSDIIGTGFTSASTVAEQLAAEASARNGSVSALTAADDAIRKRLDALEDVSAKTSSALQEVVSGTFIAVSEKADNKQTISAKTQAVASASESAQGLAEASDVKSYVDTVSRNVHTAVTGINNTISAINADIATFKGTSAQTGSIAEAKAAADKANSTIDAFLEGANINRDNKDAFVDTLKEIQDYITSDGEISEEFSTLKATVGDDTKGLVQAVNTLNGDDKTAGSVDAKVLVEKRRATAAEGDIADKILDETKARVSAIGTTADATSAETVYGAINKVAADVAGVTSSALTEVLGSTYVEVSKKDDKKQTISVKTGEGGLALQSSLTTEANTRRVADDDIKQASVASATVTNLSGLTATVASGTTGAILTIDGADLIIDCGTF